MERLLIKGKSEENIKQVANLAAKLGLTVEYLPEEISYSVNEPEALAEWNRLSAEQQQGIYEAIHEADSGKMEDADNVIREFLKKYE